MSQRKLKTKGLYSYKLVTSNHRLCPAHLLRLATQQVDRAQFNIADYFNAHVLLGYVKLNLNDRKKETPGRAMYTDHWFQAIYTTSYQ